MNRDVCEHFVAAGLRCERCEEQKEYDIQEAMELALDALIGWMDAYPHRIESIDDQAIVALRKCLGMKEKV